VLRFLVMPAGMTLILRARAPKSKIH
jgi:hypothetical protein